MALVASLVTDKLKLSELQAVLAEDFTWQTPSADPARGAPLSKAIYLAVVTADAFASLDLKVLTTTAQDNRVAAESESNGVRKDGIPYKNRYHSLWEFNPDGKISRYRIYHDTQHIADIQTLAHTQIALAFLDALTAGKPDQAEPLLANDITWKAHHTNHTGLSMDKAATLAAITGIHQVLPGFTIEPDPATITAQHNRVALQASSKATHINGRPYSNVYHFLFTIESGKIQRIDEYYDTHHTAEVFAP